MAEMRLELKLELKLRGWPAGFRLSRALPRISAAAVISTWGLER